MSEALLDGEAFTKRIINTVTLSAKFNAKTGEIDLSPIDKQRLKSAAEAMGISYDELHNMATQSRKSSMISKVVSGKGLSESQEAYLTNKEQAHIKLALFFIRRKTCPCFRFLLQLCLRV